jgi:3-oxoacyl-[acyl-carrier-protein] synthase-3
VLKKSHYISVGSYIPNKVITNFDLEKTLDTSDEWITKRTGIKTRYITENESTADLAFKACKNCLDNANFNPKDLDAIIVATCTSDQNIPSVANLVQNRLNATNAFSFDINAACSGFVYALTVVDSMIASGKIKNAVIIGVDVMSKIVDWNDRNTCILFGDGAGAMIISSEKNTDSLGIISDQLYCDATLTEILHINSNGKITMDGKIVFENAVRKLTDKIKNILDLNNLSVEDINLFIMHQANIRIIDSIAQKLNIKSEQIISTVQDFANTSAASIPITLDVARKQNKIKDKDMVLFAAVGAGLTYGVSLMQI